MGFVPRTFEEMVASDLGLELCLVYASVLMKHLNFRNGFSDSHLRCTCWHTSVGGNIQVGQIIDIWHVIYLWLHVSVSLLLVPYFNLKKVGCYIWKTRMSYIRIFLQQNELSYIKGRCACLPEDHNYEKWYQLETAVAFSQDFQILWYQ